MKKPVFDTAMTFLHEVTHTLPQPLQSLCLQVLTDPLFETAPGGSSHHHNYAGGLAEHVAEVVWGCMMLSGVRFHPASELAEMHPDAPVKMKTYMDYCGLIDIDALLTAAIWHDYHKVLEYAFHPTDTFKVPDPSAPEPPVGGERVMMNLPVITRLPYLYLVGHPVGSTLVFRDAAKDWEIDPVQLQLITHIMLAHHGRREWGSPVEPKTAEAWLLHASDMLSAQPLPTV